MSSPVVLNTRPRDQAEELSARLTRAGYQAVAAPAIEIVPVWVPAALAAVLVDLEAGAFDWVVLASQNAGRALTGHLRAARVVCGAATATALDLEPTIALDRFSAGAALAALQPRLRPGQRVLVPRAAEGRDDLLEGLHALAVAVTAPVAYQTVAVADAARRLRDGDIDVVTVCSPSAVASLAGAVDSGLLARTILVCLGATTAEAARRSGLHVSGIADRTSMTALVEAVATALARPRNQAEIPA